ncbi:MAG: CoA ester lyase [Dehalococcoidia bacterium]|nr:MAG: CoA ester lyase [Dehalococcoidia bacterium]
MDQLRTLLFVPGNRERMFERAAGARADALILDLEDAVPAAEKRAARKLVRAAAPALAKAGQLVFVRLNGIDSGQTRDDVMAVVRKGLTGVVLPKVEQPQDLRDLDVLLREAETAHRVRPGDVRTIVIVETPRGLLRCEEIARASDRVDALAAGGEDYSAALGVPRSPAALAQLRYTVVQVAAAYGKQAIDTPYVDVKDAGGLAAETAFVKSIGFKGKLVIHPGQVAAVNRIFSPNRDEVAEARRIIAAAEAGEAAGRGAVSVDGRMVDAPVVERARGVLELAGRSRRRS